MTASPQFALGQRPDPRYILDQLSGLLPKASPRPVLVMLVGLPGSGKSTLSRRLAPELEAVILESDFVRRLFFKPPTHSKDENVLLFASIHAAIDELLRRGISVILDATNLQESHRRPVYALGRNAKAPLLVIYVTAPEAIIRERLRRREVNANRDGRIEAGLEVYERLARTAEPPTKAECRVVDTSDQAGYEAAVIEIVQAVRQSIGSVTNVQPSRPPPDPVEGRALSLSKGGSRGGRP